MDNASSLEWHNFIMAAADSQAYTSAGLQISSFLAAKMSVSTNINSKHDLQLSLW